MASKILIIEDDKFLRELICRKINKEGYDIAEAIDGEEGIKKSAEVMPDLILLDLILPGIDGFGALEKIKENPKTMSIPVVILSNLGQKDEIEKGLKLGASDFLIKAHFTPEEIVEKIRLILAKNNK